MKNRLKYNDINKSNYIKNVLTLVLVIAFLFVSGRYLLKQAKQGINDIKINNNSVQQEKTVEKTENTKEVEKILPIPEQIEEREKIYAEAEKQADIKTEKEKNLPVKPVIKDDTLRTQLVKHTSNTEKIRTTDTNSDIKLQKPKTQQEKQIYDYKINAFKKFKSYWYPIQKQTSNVVLDIYIDEEGGHPRLAYSQWGNTESIAPITYALNKVHYDRFDPFPEGYDGEYIVITILSNGTELKLLN